MREELWAASASPAFGLSAVPQPSRLRVALGGAAVELRLPVRGTTLQSCRMVTLSCLCLSLSLSRLHTALY